jgi:hypothetical protein
VFVSPSKVGWKKVVSATNNNQGCPENLSDENKKMPIKSFYSILLLVCSSLSGPLWPYRNYRKRNEVDTNVGKSKWANLIHQMGKTQRKQV